MESKTIEDDYDEFIGFLDSDEMKDSLAAVQREFKRDDAMLKQNYNAVMRCLVYIKGEAFAKEVEEYMKESEATGADFGFVSTHRGQYQHEDGWQVWVDQYQHFEDMYYGWIYIYISPCRYLKFHYEC